MWVLYSKKNRSKKNFQFTQQTCLQNKQKSFLLFLGLEKLFVRTKILLGQQKKVCLFCISINLFSSCIINSFLCVKLIKNLVDYTSFSVDITSFYINFTRIELEIRTFFHCASGLHLRVRIAEKYFPHVLILIRKINCDKFKINSIEYKINRISYFADSLILCCNYFNL